MRLQQAAIHAPSHPPAFFSVAMLGGTFASILWALAWVGVAIVALVREFRFVSVSSTIGMAVSMSVSTIGCHVAWGSIKSNHRYVDPPAHPENIARRIFSWLAAIVWCAVGVVWNFGVFGWLFICAAQGRGVSLTVIVLWSLIGWFLLKILFVCMGSAIDWMFRTLSIRGDH